MAYGVKSDTVCLLFCKKRTPIKGDFFKFHFFEKALDK